MIQFNVDPYDMLMQLNVRVGLIENNLREIQLNQLQIQRQMQEQMQLIKLAQDRETRLTDFIRTTLDTIIAREQPN